MKCLKKLDKYLKIKLFKQLKGVAACVMQVASPFASS